MKICVYCKKEFDNRNKRYCSRKCQILDYAQNSDIKQKRIESRLRYFKEHPNATAFTQTREYREKMSGATSGEKNGMYGKIQTVETREKIKQKAIIRNQNPEYHKKLSESAKVASRKRWENPEYRKKQSKLISIALSKALKGVKKSKEAIENSSRGLKLAYKNGLKPWNLGYGDYIRGEKNPMFKGGVPTSYPVEFRGSLKRIVKRRYNEICQICHQKGNSVHHIDEDKNNNSLENLILLCRSCHQKLHARNLDWNQAILTLSPTS